MYELAQNIEDGVLLMRFSSYELARYLHTSRVQTNRTIIENFYPRRHRTRSRTLTLPEWNAGGLSVAAIAEAHAGCPNMLVERISRVVDAVQPRCARCCISARSTTASMRPDVVRLEPWMFERHQRR